MLKQKIQDDIKEALRNSDELRVSVLRMLSAAILSKEKDKRYRVSKDNPQANEQEIADKSLLEDEEVVQVVSSEAKKRKEAILAYEKGGRKELAEKEKKELEILIKYMPAQISGEELKKMVKEAVDKTGAKEIKDMGKIMAELMPKIKGKADGEEVSKIAKEIFKNN